MEESVKEYVYVISFKGFIKVGFSKNPKSRIKGVSRIVKQSPIESFYREFEDGRGMEQLIKWSLSEFTFPVHGIKRETFKHPYSPVKDGLMVAEFPDPFTAVNDIEADECRKLSRSEKNEIMENTYSDFKCLFMVDGYCG